VNVPHNGETLMLTGYGKVFRRMDGEEEWNKYYDVLLSSVGAHVGMVRKAPFQKILVDNYEGDTPEAPTVATAVAEPRGRTYRTKTGKELTDKDIEALAKEAEAGYDVSHLDPAEGQQKARERRSRVAKTTDAPKKEKTAPKADAVDKPQRLGARAKKLLEMDLGLTTKEKETVRAKADAISRDRILPNGKHDGLTRVWDIYEAAGKEMPASIATEKEDFMKTGVLKRSRSGNGNGSGTPKETRGGKNAASPTPSSGTSTQQQAKPDPKPESGGPQEDASPPKSEAPTSETSPEETETL
jgi:hypothetical protein